MLHFTNMLITTIFILDRTVKLLAVRSTSLGTTDAELVLPPTHVVDVQKWVFSLLYTVNIGRGRPSALAELLGFGEKLLDRESTRTVNMSKNFVIRSKWERAITEVIYASQKGVGRVDRGSDGDGRWTPWAVVEVGACRNLAAGTSFNTNIGEEEGRGYESKKKRFGKHCKKT